MIGASGVAIAIHTISRPQLHRVSAVINITLRGFSLFNRRYVSLFEVQALRKVTLLPLRAGTRALRH
jgi:hypothetical protein